MTTSGSRRTTATSRRAPATCTTSGIACALAHPFFAVAAPLLPRHRRRLAELFPIWETRNGSRARELNQPAAVYIETHGGTGVGGSDDHAGVDIGRTYTETPPASAPEELLDHLRSGRARPRGEEGSAAKWAHAAMAIATRVLGEEDGAAPDPRAVFCLVERVVREADTRGGAIGADLGPDDARGLLEAWLRGVGVEARGRAFLEMLQADGFSHADLYRRARRAHERDLRAAVSGGLAGAVASADLAAAATGLFSACLPAVPYAPATAFLGRETARLHGRGEAPLRVALVADGVGEMHGVTRTVEEIRERGVPDFEVEVLGTDPNVDRRLSAVADVELPFSAGLRVGVPEPARGASRRWPRAATTSCTSARPARWAWAPALVARVMDLPVAGSYHTELAAYAGLRSGDPRLEAIAGAGLAAFYGQCHVVLTPSPSSDDSVARARHQPRARPALGPRRRLRALLADAAGAGRPPRPGQGALRRPADEGEGRRPAGRRVPRGRAGAIRACTSSSPAAGPRRTPCAPGSATAPRSSAGSRARSSRAPTRTPTCSCSPAGPTPSARSSSRRRRAACRSSRSARAARRRSSRTAAAVCCARPTPRSWARCSRASPAPPPLRARLALGGLDAVAERTWERSLARLADGWRAAIDRHGAGRQAAVAA